MQPARPVWVAPVGVPLASGQALMVLVSQQVAATAALLVWRPAAALALLV